MVAINPHVPEPATGAPPGCRRPVVTTSRDANTPPWTKEAQSFAAAVDGTYVPRDDHPIRYFFQLGFPVVVVGGDGITVYTEEGPFSYHPGMGRTRVRRLRKGGTDPMVEAMDLRPGDAVLDCTLGLGADAVVASYVVGAEGRVVGWESVPVLAELVRRGLQTYTDPDPEFVAALRRIRVEQADHRERLPTLPDKSFDVVYFDPMFREPVYESSHLLPLRALTNHDPVLPESLREARRVARRRVVMKERRDSPLWQELGFHQVVGGRSSRIAYGIMFSAG